MQQVLVPAGIHSAKFELFSKKRPFGAIRMAFFLQKLNKFAVLSHILKFHCLDWKLQNLKGHIAEYV